MRGASDPTQSPDLGSAKNSKVPFSRGVGFVQRDPKLEHVKGGQVAETAVKKHRTEYNIQL